MPIYEKPVRLLFYDMIKDLGFHNGRSVRGIEIQSWFREKYPKINPNTVNAHLTKMTTNARSRVWHQVEGGTHDIFFKTAPGLYRLYDKASDPQPIYQKREVALGTPTPFSVHNASDRSAVLLSIPSDSELDRRRRAIIKILRSLDNADDNPSAQLCRLKRVNLIPRHIASLIFVVLEYRNILVYEDFHITESTEALAVNAAWTVVEAWANANGLSSK